MTKEFEEVHMKIKIDDGAFVPTRAHEADAGLDLYSPIDTMVGWAGSSNGNSVTIDTGVHMEIPKGYVGFLKSKSGLNVKHGIVSEGVIDSGYTGSIAVKLYNHSDKAVFITRGMKISQIVLLPIITPELELVDELEQTERGDGGFGSTGY
jgi:dUTP pyrophosphatase